MIKLLLNIIKKKKKEFTDNGILKNWHQLILDFIYSYELDTIPHLRRGRKRSRKEVELEVSLVSFHDICVFIKMFANEYKHRNTFPKHWFITII